MDNIESITVKRNNYAKHGCHASSSRYIDIFCYKLYNIKEYNGFLIFQ